MITLRSKLYESLLDDEEIITSKESVIPDLINNWANEFGIKITNTLSKNTSSIKINKDNSVSAKLLNLIGNKKFTLNQLFDQPFQFKQLDCVILGCGTLTNCSDLIDDSQYKYFPPVIKQLEMKFYNQSNAFHIDFNKLNSIQKLEDLSIRIYDPGFTIYDPGFTFYDLTNPPEMKLKSLKLSFPNGILNLDSLSGLNCEALILDTFTNSDHKNLIVYPKASYDMPKFYSENTNKAYDTISKFFSDNNVDKLFIQTAPTVLFEIIKHGHPAYIFKKTSNVYGFVKR